MRLLQPNNGQCKIDCLSDSGGDAGSTQQVSESIDSSRQVESGGCKQIWSARCELAKSRLVATKRRQLVKASENDDKNDEDGPSARINHSFRQPGELICAQVRLKFIKDPLR